MKPLLVTLALGGIMTTALGQGGEISYLEDFALAKDRAAALAQLVPGTEDYFYYHCLHYQQTEQSDEVENMLKRWIQQHNYTDRVREIQNRQALLTYDRNPRKSLDYIRQQLGVEFNHQRQQLDRERQLPTQLDSQSISRQSLADKAYRRHKNLAGFTDRALDWLVATELNADQRRHLLERLKRPDYPNLPDLVIEDLNHKGSRGFGSLGIHRQLLTSQLDECVRLKPALMNHAEYVNIYVQKLRPNDDIDWRNDPDEQKAYLDRLWKFAAQLEPIHNSLKAHVLYHQLTLDRSRGVYNKQRFMQYLRIPRAAGYIPKRLREAIESQRFAANLGHDFKSVTGLAIVGNDEPLVRAYLAHFFEKETSYKAYEPFVDDTYLKHLFAETKIVLGLGDPERWSAMLPPEKYRALRDRVDLDFAPENPQVFKATEPVALDLFVKNVDTLIVKVFEINTRNYYQRHQREVNTDINLDGLVANEETTHTYDNPPLRRVRRHFEFPALTQPGTYVIDFIGNGKSSRAVVRKGQLRYLVRTTTAGHVFTILDDENRQLDDATLWLAGREYRADEKGRIIVPFSNQPGRQAIVLSDGNRSSLHFYQHQSENYQLTASFYVDREALLRHKQAKVLVRPSLTLNGIPATLGVLTDVQLLITSTDHDDTQTTQTVDDFQLSAERESEHTFQVPPRLAQIAFTLKAKVKVLSQNRDQDLAAAKQFALNEIERTEKIEDLHLSRADGRFVLELLGRTGEPKPRRPVRLQIKHRDFVEPVKVTLQSDEVGRVHLGSLAEIEQLTATGTEDTSHTWQLDEDRFSFYRTVHGRAKEPIRVPYLGDNTEPQRDELSLLELRGNTYVADRFDALSLVDGFIQIQGLAAGDYDLWIKPSQTQIRLRVTEGAPLAGYVLGESRQLEMRNSQPLHIQSVDVGEKQLTLQLRNVSEHTRVHVFATRFEPAFSAFAHLGEVRDAEPLMRRLGTPRSLYLAGRNIGDEYRYILDRKFAQKYPGTMLERPSLLLNPWDIRSTETGEQASEAGEEFAPADEAPTEAAAREGRPPQQEARLVGFANLDFLAESATVLVNLEPDKDGTVTITRKELGPHQQLQIVAVDPVTTVSRIVSLPKAEDKFADLRLATGLDPKLHFTQQKQVTIVDTGETFNVADIASSRFVTYDSLAGVHSLFVTLTGDEKLTEFSWILQWPKLNDSEKQDKYSEYACHELNFFLSKKDPQFFESVVQPYLAHKKDKTFLDDWLLGRDLAMYTAPWNHAQLNIVERILLGQRLSGEGPHAQQHVRDLFELLPRDVDRWNQLFQTALVGQALDTADRFGVRKAAEVLSRAETASKRRSLRRFSADRIPEGADARQYAEAADVAAAAPEVPQAEGEERRLRLRWERSTRGAERDARVADLDVKLGELAEAEELAFRAGRIEQFYRKLDKTKEWVENNYYRLPIEQQNAELVTVNAFWDDYARHASDRPFYSPHLAEASRNFTEMMFALAVFDLPFEAAEHDAKFDGPRMTLTAKGPIVVYHEQIRPVANTDKPSSVLVSQNFFRHGERFRHENGEQVDNFVADEFVVHTLYGCHVVVTNTSSAKQKLDVLLQVPIGAIPALGSQYTRSLHVELEPYRTQTLDYHFYFPAVGSFPHFPVHVAKNEALLAHVAPVTLNVVKEPTQIDRRSWQYVSQFGSPEDVIVYLRENNPQRLDLDRIAFRMQDKAFFERVTNLLRDRHVYNHTLWSYGIRHNVASAARQYLQHSDDFVGRCGDYVDSPLLALDPVIRKTYQHVDYRPLVNARAHQLGRRRQIVNDRLLAQYHRLLSVLSYRSSLDADDLMSVTYYMLLQDRIGEALEFFTRVDADQLRTRLQYDYFAAYLDCFNLDPQVAPTIVAKYANYPVVRWRNAFEAVRVLLDEVAGKAGTVVDPESRDQQQAKLAASEPSFEFDIEGEKVQLRYQNLDEVTVNYYLMDLELLFSRNPFARTSSDQFSHIRPNQTLRLDLSDGAGQFEFQLPEALHTSNVLVEVVGAGKSKSQAYYANSLEVQLMENYGQLRVTDRETGKNMPRVYVKAYARLQDGSVRFYKDGYTDLRGRFDYTSLNTNELDMVQRFSLLVMSDDRGAVVREASPPKR